MDSKSKVQNGKFSSEEFSNQEEVIIEKLPQSTNIEEICDENLITLKKIHAILLNCLNLNEKEKLEFCNSERYFMKLYLKKLND
ncbi:MAG: hypothetical protein ACFFFT_19715, partial [Candidatus Thorarchaeota archaeon]